MGYLTLAGRAPATRWSCRQLPALWARRSDRSPRSPDAGRLGSPAGRTKVAQCREIFGYDVAIDYKSGNIESALAAACPKGVDLYFDNTGGAISDTVLRQLAVGGRVVICGTASVPTWNPWPNGPRAERHLLVKRARMQGFVIFDYAHRFEEAITRLAGWVRDGRLRYAEDVLEGIEQAPGAIGSLYRGENTGKRLIKIG